MRSCLALLFVLAACNHDAMTTDAGPSDLTVLAPPDLCAGSLTDPMNCGSCGCQCQAGSACSQGTCVAGCNGGVTSCPVPIDGGAGVLCRQYTCRDLNTDNDNCGQCGKKCPAGMTCVQGACA